MTVASLAADPANDKKKVAKASYPVDLLLKFCKIYGNLDNITINITYN